MEEKDAPRISVVGAGAVGGYFGGMLARAGLDVAFLARGENARVIRERGLDVKCVNGDFRVQPAVSEDPAEIGRRNLVLFAVKSYDTPAAALVLPELLSPSGRVLTLQNGVESEPALEAVVGREALLVGCAYIQASRTAPGCIEQVGGPCRIVFGEPGRKPGPAAQRIRDVLAAGGIACELADDVGVAQWTKFVLISAVAGVCGVERLPLGEVIANGPTRTLLAGAMRETIAVGRARGVALPPGVVDRCLEIVATFPYDSKPSLLHDLEGRRRLEIDALSGAVVRLGAEVGVQTPIHRELYACLKPWDDLAARPEKMV